jgi:hypothetical protein
MADNNATTNQQRDQQKRVVVVVAIATAATSVTTVAAAVAKTMAATVTAMMMTMMTGNSCFLPLLTTVAPSEGTIAQVVHSYNTTMTQLLLPSHFVLVGTIIAFGNIDHPNGGIIMIT